MGTLNPVRDQNTYIIHDDCKLDSPLSFYRRSLPSLDTMPSTPLENGPLRYRPSTSCWIVQLGVTPK